MQRSGMTIGCDSKNNKRFINESSYVKTIMDIYKLKFTRLQNEIIRLLCINAGKSINQRNIAKKLGVSPTAIAKALKELERDELIKKDKDSLMNLNLITLNRNNEKSIQLKRIENLKIIYQSEMIAYLEENFIGSTLILFGSYSTGEDTIRSDIDLAVIGSRPKVINIQSYEKLLERKINLQFYSSFKEINKNLKTNLYNGIVLSGAIDL